MKRLLTLLMLGLFLGLAGVVSALLVGPHEPLTAEVADHQTNLSNVVNNGDGTVNFKVTWVDTANDQHTQTEHVFTLKTAAGTIKGTWTAPGVYPISDDRTWTNVQFKKDGNPVDADGGDKITVDTKWSTGGSAGSHAYDTEEVPPAAP